MSAKQPPKPRTIPRGAGMRGAQCTSPNSLGEQCGNNAISGMKVCYLHGGKTPLAKRALEQRRAKDERKAERHLAFQEAFDLAMIEFGLPEDMDPTEALLKALRAACGDVQFWRLKVQALDELTSRGPAGSTGVHPFVAEYNGAQVRQAKFAELALKAGIAERQIQLAEQQGELIANILITLLDDPTLALTAEQREIGRNIAAQQLRLLAS